MKLSELTPDLILDAVESVGLHCDGHLLTLNSYENRVYQIGICDDKPLIAKFYRPERWSDQAILEEHALVGELRALEIPVLSAQSYQGQTLHHYQDYRFSLFARQGGRAPELSDPQTLNALGRAIARMHAVGATRPYLHRPALDIETFGVEASEYLLQHNFIPPELREVYQNDIQLALERVRRCYQQAGDVQYIRLHGDCHPGNVLWSDDAPYFVDFDDSRMGPAIQDIWMLLAGERAERNQQLLEIMLGYEDFYEFNVRELHLIEALRTLRLIHYSAWLARRWDDPSFQRAFPWFNMPQYWQQKILELREQMALMDEEPLFY